MLLAPGHAAPSRRAGRQRGRLCGAHDRARRHGRHATVEYKINFVAAFPGGELRASGRVVQAGRRSIVTTAEVLHHGADGATAVCALMQQTLLPVANGTHRSITDNDTARRPLP